MEKKEIKKEIMGKKESMGKKEIMEMLQQDIMIPQIVQQKAANAFQRIHKENDRIVRIHSRKRKWKTLLAAVAAAVFMLGMTVCAAAYVRWSRGLEAEFQMTQEEKRFLEEEQYMTPVADNNEVQTDDTNQNTPTKSVTANGITITPLQMIVDDRFAWLSFQVEGYDLKEGKEPCFEGTSIVVDNNERAIRAYSSHFYNGLHYDETAGFLYDDGTPAVDAEGNVIEKYVNENGCMEYIILINGSEYEKGLVGASLHVGFKNLGTVYKATFSPDLEAEWDFDMELKGSNEVRKVSLSEPLGDTGATVTYAEISPISLHVTYDFPLRKTTIEGVNEKGEAITSTTFEEPPNLSGVRLKDGTLLTGIINGGTEGYSEENREVYTASFATARVIDTKEVDALLFLKNVPNRGSKLTEENLYVVPIQ